MARANLKRWFRFSLGTLLFAALCVAGYFSGYRNGFGSGKADRKAGTIYVKVYPVADLITPLDKADTPEARRESTDALIDLIVSTVDHDTWMENGSGEGEIQPFPANNSLIISQSGRVHNQVAALLDQLRKLSTEVEVEQTIPLIQSLAANQRTDPVTIRKAAGGGKGAAAIDLLFDSAVENMADRWGDPDFRGAATDRGFPAWSVAQRLAVWPKGDGLAYIAVQEDAQDGHVLLAGWHAEK